MEAAKIRTQRKMAQMKEQNKTPEKELNKMETSNLLNSEFKTLVIRMLDELSENVNSIKKDMETMEKNLSEINDILAEMKNNLQGINSRDETKNQISNLEYKGEGNTQSEKQK